MKKIIMILVAALTVSVASLVKAQEVIDSIRTPEQRVETIDKIDLFLVENIINM